MSDSEASAADAAITNQQRHGQGPDNSGANTAQRSIPSNASTPSRKRKGSKKSRHQRKRSCYDSGSSETSESTDSSAWDDSSQDSSSDDSDTSVSSDSEDGENEIPTRANRIVSSYSTRGPMVL